MRYLLAVTLLAVLPAACQIELSLPATADTNLSSHPSEVAFTYGARSTVRIKGIEMFWLLKFRTDALAGHRVAAARLRFKPVRHEFRTLGFSTIAADWTEDRGTGDAALPGTCFLHRGLPEGGTAPWARPGGDFTDVAFTAGHTLVSYAPVTPEAAGWLSAEVAPALVEALVSGASDGLCVSDEVGQTRANNDVWAREQANSAPVLVVNAVPAAPPAARLTSVAVMPAPATTVGQGAATLAYEVTAAAEDLPRFAARITVNQAVLPRWQVPAVRAGRNELTLSDLPAGQPLTIEVEVGPAKATASGVAGTILAAVKLPAVAAREPHAASPVWAVPGGVSVHPRTGTVLEEVGATTYAGPSAGRYRSLNPVWSAAGVRLAGARGETVSCQLVAAADQPPAPPQLGELRSAQGPLAVPPEVFAVWYVPDPEPVAEVAVPLALNPRQELAGRRYWTTLVELTIPSDATPGTHLGVWRYGGVALPVELVVWRHALPAELGFDVSLNSYGRVSGLYGLTEEAGDQALAVEVAYHRLAHQHRLTWAPLTYGQSGRLDWGAGPQLTGEGAATRCDFTAYDRRWGPLLNGEAFRGLPRDGVPLDHAYLPFHENWPGPMDAYRFRPRATEFAAQLTEHALLAPPIAEAFPEAYQEQFVAVAGAFARHLKDRGWTRTAQQCYLNNKYNYRDPQQGGRGTSWWLLDEPMHRDDWLALRFYAELFLRGARQVADGAPLLVRADISRPQWQRDWLDGCVQLDVLGNAFYSYPARTMEWVRREGAVAWNYSSASRVGAPRTDQVGWCLRAWLTGADGVVPWNSIGADRHFEQAEQTALLLPGRRFGMAGPLASLRLKALRDGQQEVERLRLLAAARGWSREQLAGAVAGVLDLAAEANRRRSEDAGVLTFKQLSPDDVARLREAVAAALEAPQ